MFLPHISNIFYKILRKICIKLDTFCAYTGTSVFTLTTKMANREVLNTQKRKKSNVLMAEIPIKLKTSASDGVIPDIPGHENLPPLHLASYSAISADVPPTVSFQEIYKHMILRLTRSGKPIDNHKGLDKAVKHFEAGDLSQIMTAQVKFSFIYM